MILGINVYIDGQLIGEELVIPDTVTAIESGAFRNCTNVKSLIIPESVTTIGIYAFKNCTSLTNITFEGNSQLEVIESGAFENCVSLTSIDIPDGTIELGYEAFDGCSSLKTVKVPDSVLYIDRFNFDGCTSLTSIIVGENNPKYMSIDGNLYSKDGKTLIKYAAGKKDATFEIPEGVTTIGYKSFGDCQYISTIIIPDSVTIIENYAFYGCVRLEYNVYENGNYLGNESNPYMVLVEVISTEVTSLTINENCKIISPMAFSTFIS